MADDVQQKPSAALRLILIASLLLLLLAAGGEWLERRPVPPAPEAREGPRDELILPGQRVSFITLGLAASRVEEVLGRGEIRPQEDTLLHLYEREGLLLASQEGRVLSIVVKSPQFQTRDGIRVGSDVDGVIRTYGEGYEFDGSTSAYVLHYWSAGIHFRVEKTVVVSIQVTEPVLAGSVGRSDFGAARRGAPCQPVFPS